MKFKKLFGSFEIILENMHQVFIRSLCSLSAAVKTKEENPTPRHS